MNSIAHLQIESILTGGGVLVRWLNPLDVAFDHVKILRVTGSGPITGSADPTATVVLSGKGTAINEYRAVFRPDPPLQKGQARQFFDLTVEPNQLYTYAIYAANAGETDISAQVSQTVTVADIVALDEPDIVGLLLPFLRAGMARALVTGSLKIPKKTADQITALPVVEGPPRLEALTFPCVSIHLDDDSPSDYVVGDVTDSLAAANTLGVNGLGYFSVQTITVAGWAQGPEIRRSLYRTLKGLLMAARRLLAAAGVEKSEFSGSYREEFEAYDFDLFFCEFRMRVWVLSRVEYVQGPTINEIDVTVQAV